MDLTKLELRPLEGAGEGFGVYPADLEGARPLVVVTQGHEVVEALVATYNAAIGREQLAETEGHASFADLFGVMRGDHVLVEFLEAAAKVVDRPVGCVVTEDLGLTLAQPTDADGKPTVREAIRDALEFERTKRNRAEVAQ